jgi:autotransporter translocation and assembly factor TamB
LSCTSTGDARPELVVQLTPRIALEVSYAVAQPPPGQPPDRTFLTIDLRLLRRWSLSTSMGDRGASTADLIWRHNY